MSASYYLTAVFDKSIPWWQLGSCSVTWPCFSLHRVWLVLNLVCPASLWVGGKGTWYPLFAHPCERPLLNTCTSNSGRLCLCIWSETLSKNSWDFPKCVRLCHATMLKCLLLLSSEDEPHLSLVPRRTRIKTTCMLLVRGVSTFEGLWERISERHWGAERTEMSTKVMWDLCVHMQVYKSYTVGPVLIALFNYCVCLFLATLRI